MYTMSIVRDVRHCGKKMGHTCGLCFLYRPLPALSGQVHVLAIIFVLVAHRSGKGVLLMCILYPLCASFTAVEKRSSYVWIMLFVPVAIGSG